MRFVNTTSSGTPPGPDAGYRGATLAELMGRQKMAQTRQADIVGDTSPIPSPWQGAAKLANTFVAGMQERNAAQELSQGRDALASIYAGIDPSTGATQDQLAQASRVDPEMAQQLYTQAVALRNQPKWEPMTAAERVQYNVPDGSLGQINRTTGQVDMESPSAGTTINNMPEGKGQTKWEEENAKAFSEQFAATAKEGAAAAPKLAQIGVLEQIAPDMLTGAPGKLALWAKDKFGIDLGEHASNAQVFDSIVSGMVPTQRPEGSGTMSDRDIDLFKAALPRVGNDPRANALIFKYMRGMAEYQQKLGMIANQARLKGDPQEALMFFNTEGAKLGNPLAGIEEALKSLDGAPAGAPAPDGAPLPPGSPAPPMTPPRIIKTPVEEEFGL